MDRTILRPQIVIIYSTWKLKAFSYVYIYIYDQHWWKFNQTCWRENNIIPLLSQCIPLLSHYIPFLSHIIPYCRGEKLLLPPPLCWKIHNHQKPSSTDVCCFVFFSGDIRGFVGSFSDVNTRMVLELSQLNP